MGSVGAPTTGAQIEAAHRKAVASAIARVERDVELVRRRQAGVLRWERARSLARAEFVHTSSRLTRGQEGEGVPDPQLHSHVVVLAAERWDGQFAAVDSRELFRSARVNGAWYRAELAFELGELGIDVRGRAGKDARYFEAQGVPLDLAKRWSARTDVTGRLAQRVAVSHSQQASVTRDAVEQQRVDGLAPVPLVAVERAGGDGVVERAGESRVGRVLREQQERERARGRDHGID